MPRVQLQFDVNVKDRELNRLLSELKKYQERTNQSVAASSALDSSFANLTKSATALTAAYVSLNAINNAIKQAEQFQQAIIGVEKTTGLAGKELGDLQNRIFYLGATIKGVKTDELLAIAQTAGQLGIKGVDNIATFTETIAKVGVATDLTAEQAATSFATLQNILGLTTKDLGRLGSVFNEVSNNSTALVSDLVEFTTRLAGAGKTIGLAYDEIIGLAAALKDTGNNFEVGGSAVSRALQLMISDTDKFAQASGVSFEEFSKTLNTKPIEAVKLFIGQLSRLDKVSRLEALEKVGLTGVEASGTFLKLAEGIDAVERNLKTANNEFKNGASLQKEYEAASRSSIASTERLSNVFDQFENRVSAPFLGIKTYVTDVATTMVLVFDEGVKQVGFRVDDLSVRFKRLSTGTLLELAKSAKASFGETFASYIGASAENIKELETEFNSLVKENEEIGKASEESLKAYRALTDEILNGSKKATDSQRKLNDEIEKNYSVDYSFPFESSIDLLKDSSNETEKWNINLQLVAHSALDVAKALEKADKFDLIPDIGGKVGDIFKEIDKGSILGKSYQSAIAKATKQGIFDGSEKAWDAIEAEGRRIATFANSIGYAVEGALTDAIIQGLEGDFDPQSILKGLGSSLVALGLAFELQIAASVSKGIAEGASGFGAVAVGAGLIGLSGAFGEGGGGRKITFDEQVDLAFNNLIQAIKENTKTLELQGLGGTALSSQIQDSFKNISESFTNSDKALIALESGQLTTDDLARVAEVTRSGTLEEKQAVFKDVFGQGELGTGGFDIVKLQSSLDAYNQTILENSQAFEQTGLGLSDLSIALGNTELEATRIDNAFSRLGVSTKEEFAELINNAANAGEALADANTTWENLTTEQQNALIAAQNYGEEIDILSEYFGIASDGVGDLTEKFKEMATSLDGVSTQQQQFIDSQIGLVQSGKDNIDYLKERLKIEDAEADAARAAVIAAGGNVTAEQIAALAKEEQDVLTTGQLLNQRATEVFGATQQATDIIQSTIDTVKINQEQTVTIQNAMLQANFDQVDLLTEVRDALYDLRANLGIEIADELARIG